LLAYLCFWFFFIFSTNEAIDSGHSSQKILFGGNRSAGEPARSPTQDEVQTLMDKINELIAGAAAITAARWAGPNPGTGKC
jgi:hypothetical protein